jgi:hypothetical protein
MFEHSKSGSDVYIVQSFLRVLEQNFAYVENHCTVLVCKLMLLYFVVSLKPSTKMHTFLVVERNSNMLYLQKHLS